METQRKARILKRMLASGEPERCLKMLQHCGPRKLAVEILIYSISPAQSSRNFNIPKSAQFGVLLYKALSDYLVGPVSAYEASIPC
jgi:hypothetical protein